MGKSRLLEEIQCSNLDNRSEAVTVVRAAASTAHRSRVMYPWRRVFKSLFAHDRSWGTQYTLREKDAMGCPMQVTRLGMRLAECGCEWLEWRKSLSVFLEVLEDEMPVLPAAQHETALENAAAGIGLDSEAEDSLKENMPSRLGNPSKSLPAMSMPAMQPESAKSVAIPAPSVGSPLAAYAEALPEDAVSLVQVKAWEAASLTKSLSEGTAQGFRESIRASLDLNTAERHEGAASVPIDPPNFMMAKAGRMTSRLNSEMMQYLSSVRNQSPEQAASAPMEVDKMPRLWRCQDNSTPASFQQGSPHCLTRHRRTPKSAECWHCRSGREGAVQATARLQVPPSTLTKHTSLASLARLASSLRSEELSRRALNRQTHTGGSSSHNGLDADLYGLRQHSMRSRQTSRNTHPSSASSFVDFMDSDSSAYNSVNSQAAAGSPGQVAADTSGCRGPQMERTPSSEGSQGIVGWLSIRPHHDQASASWPRSLSRTGHAQGAGSNSPLSLSRAPSGELTSASSACSISTAHAAGSQAIAWSRSGTLTSDPVNEHVGAQTLQSRQRPSFQRTDDSSGLISAGLAGYARQALIPIRSGEVEFFVRHQMQRPSPALPSSILEAGADQNSSSEATDANSAACCAIDPGQDTKERVMRVTCAAKASMRPKQHVSAVLKAFSRACSVETPAGVPKRPSTSLSKADSTSIPVLRPVASGPLDFDTLCDAAIAAVRAPTTQAKAAPDAKAGKTAGRSGKRSIFGAKRSVAPRAKLAAHEATGQAGGAAERARQESTPPGLPGMPEAESMLPKLALQELSRTALARLATSNAWQEKEESGLASAKHAAASVPLEGLKGAFWDMQIQDLQVKNTSLAHSLPSRQPAAATGAHNATQRQKRHVPPGLKALKLQELLITVLREWTRAYGPLLLLLDDFDRADALSWSFLARCAEEIDTAVLVVAAIRPNDGIFAMPSLGHVAKTAVHARVSALCTDIRQNPFTLRLVMQPFTPEQTHAFLAAALKGVHVSVEVARNLWEKTGGLPLYIEQMVVYMQQQHGANGLDALDDLSAFIRSTVTIHSLITDRIDKLQPSQQLTFKIASVMGMSVSVGLLQATYPIAVTAEVLERDLLELERANFLRPTDIPGTWLMTQVLARDVAYELIPFSQRRSLHAQLAKALEDDISADLMPPSTVAYHWTHSCAGAEATHWRRALHAVDWWEKAAQTAVEEGIDPAEAIGLFQRADEIAGILKAAYNGQTPRGHSASSWFSFGAARWAASSAHSGLSSGSSYGLGAMLDWSSRQVHPVRRAHWHRCMASLHLAQGDLDTARLHGLQALHYMGAPLPADSPGKGSLFASCMGLVQNLSVGRCLGGGFGQRRVSSSGSSASDASIYNDMAAWIADSLRWPGQENEAGEMPTAGIDWGRRKLQEAAAVLELLVNASLVLSPIDAEALRYVCKTARLLQGVTFVKRFPQDSPLLPVVKKCKSVLAETGAGPRAML